MRFCKVALVALACLLALSTSAAPRGSASGQTANWPQWRGPGGTGISPEKNFPLVWSATENVKWRASIPGRGHSSPIVWGDKVFLTTSIEGPVVPGAGAVIHYRGTEEYVHPDSVGADRSHTHQVLCLDRVTGKILWNRTAYQGIVYDNRHRNNSYASGTPVTDGRWIYAFFEAEGLYCYDFDGKLIWQASLGKIAKGGMGYGVSPVLYGDLIILQVDQEGLGLTRMPRAADAQENPTQYGENSAIVALDKATGKEVWRTPRNNRRSWATPILIKTPERMELVASGAETVVSYDPASGRELWRGPGVVSHPIPSPVTGHGMVYLSAGSSRKLALAVRLGGSGELAEPPFVAWKYDRGTAYVTSPILHGDYLYLVSDAGIVTCLEAVSGAVKYQERVPVPASFRSSPVAFDDKILLSSEDGDTFVIKAGPSHEIIGTNSVGEPIWASLALSQGQIFIRGEKSLFCIGKQE